VPEKINEYEDKIKKAQQDFKNELTLQMLKKNEEKKKNIDMLGSWDNGDIIHRIIGARTVDKSG
jgi:hypothetical protein